ncbi:UDP-N-acetylmuramoyl-tripeptide--D-alanyl-D-alanine ligase [Geodia barretti]|uniref:UDP-N-acetylmuramoyl-tripeptide--D-alanyl-D-alani ne ligase n=1 Tax=Geodia barretti TaxID=519541 RepID=A0AA35SLY3_GEOBA|nr:UDP-N-acetylmuramoyl-tripeptide--D-alanyl-D-alanine ligase [Geodia barretti]
MGSILRQGSRSLVSEASFNAEIGLPMSVLRMTGHERFAVFEVGISSVGEMERYAALARPEPAVITNIGSAHIGRLGSPRDIAREKGALLRSVAPAGRVYLREGEPAADLLLAGVRAKVVRFGSNSTIGYERSENLGLDGWSIHWEGLQFRFSLPGRHNLDNALAALTVATELACDPATVAAGIEAVRPAPGRLRVRRARCTVIDDGYNANPDRSGRLWPCWPTRGRRRGVGRHGSATRFRGRNPVIGPFVGWWCLGRCWSSGVTAPARMSICCDR